MQDMSIDEGSIRRTRTPGRLASVRWRSVYRYAEGWVRSLVRAVLVIGICFVILYPIAIKLISSVMTERDVLDPTVAWVPRQITFDNYYMCIRYGRMIAAGLYSMKLALLVSALQLASCTCIGYGLARFEFRGSGLLFLLVIVTLIVPPQLIMIPLFLNFRFFDLFGLIPGQGINMIGKFYPYILLALTGMGLKNGLYIFIMRQFFKGMPQDLEDAAYVDGAGALRTFVSVMLPGAVPAMVIVFLFSFVWQWNDTFYAQMFLPNANTIATALAGVRTRVSIDYVPTFPGDLPRAEYLTTVQNAGMMLFIAPPLVIYAFLQRFFTESIERTGLVG